MADTADKELARNCSHNIIETRGANKHRRAASSASPAALEATASVVARVDACVSRPIYFIYGAFKWTVSIEAKSKQNQ